MKSMKIGYEFVQIQFAMISKKGRKLNEGNNGKSLYESTRKGSIDVNSCSALMNRDQWENLMQNIAAALKGCPFAP